MALAIAIIGLIGTLVSVWLFYARRKRTPTPMEREDDIDNKYAYEQEQLRKMERIGDFAGADALRRRMRERHQ